MKKRFSFIFLSFLLILSVSSFSGCTQTDSGSSAKEETVDSSQQTEKSFTLLIVDPDGKETTMELSSNKETVGEALTDLNLIQGEESSYGLYVKTVNNITVDYDKDKLYWAFYIDGEYAQTGVDSTPLEDGVVYAFKVEK